MQKLTDIKNQLTDKTQLVTDLQKQLIEALSQLEMYKNMHLHNRDVIESIAKQTKNTILSSIDMVEETFTDTINEFLDKNYVIDGQKGIAKFAYDYLLKDDNNKLMYICTDPSRHIFRFLSPDGQMVRDINANKLISSIAESVKNKSAEITINNVNNENRDIYISKFQEIADLKSNNYVFRTELASFTSH
jgi:hypothetical protein